MIRFDNVGMHYGPGPEVLKDVSFLLEKGSFHFLTGPSGAGKTTLLKLLYLAQRQTSGRISFFGQETGSIRRGDLPALRRRIGVVFQDFRLFDHLTAAENVALPLRIAGVSENTIRGHVRELLAWAGLGDRMDARPQTLSGGEKQRVAIARAVIGKPDILLADEPTGNVDPAIAGRLMHLFLELNKMGTTMVIATHDPAIVEHAGAPLMKLEGGTVRFLPAGSSLAEAGREDA